MRTLPTICSHSWSVSRVCCHSDNGRAGHDGAVRAPVGPPCAGGVITPPSMANRRLPSRPAKQSSPWGGKRRCTRPDAEPVRDGVAPRTGADLEVHTRDEPLAPGADPVHKISIIARGRALGVTFQVPQ